MFGIEWTEYAVIAIVALIVIGPKELPAVLRTIGQWTTKIRRMAAEFQGQFQEALREAEMADLKKEVDSLNDAARGFTSQFDDPLNLKEATKWEGGPDAAKADDKADDVKPDDAPKPADVPPEVAPLTADPRPPYSPPHEAESREDAEAPVAAEHLAIAQTPTVPSPAGAGGEGGGTADAAPAPPVTPPAAQPPLPDGSSHSGAEGAVHS